MAHNSPQTGGCKAFFLSRTAPLKRAWIQHGARSVRSEDLIDSWTLTPEDHVRIAGKSRDNRLAFAVLLLFFRANGRFPDVAEIHPSIVALVAQQLGVDTGPIADQAWQGRTGKRHRAEIRILFGFREPTVADGEAMVAWLRDHAVAHSHDPEHLTATLKDTLVRHLMEI